MLFCYHFANTFYPITTSSTIIRTKPMAKPSIVPNSGISSPVINVIVIFISYLAAKINY